MQDFALRKKRGRGQKVLMATILGVIAIIVVWRFALSERFEGKTEKSQTKDEQSTQSALPNQLTPQDISTISGVISTQGPLWLERDHGVKTAGLKIISSPTLDGQIAYAPIRVETEEKETKNFVVLMIKEGNFWRIMTVKDIN
jgi:hypothetical protein